GRARNDPVGTGGSTADSQLTHSDPNEGLANAQTGVTTASTDRIGAKSSSQIPGNTGFGDQTQAGGSMGAAGGNNNNNKQTSGGQSGNK
ncbi:unnamed protein product, partial [Didymodactylos carnosus]